MPPFSRWIIRVALLYLLLGFTVGGLLLTAKGFPVEMNTWAPGLWRLLAVHIDLLFTGWLVQFIIGVAYWILPRASDYHGAPTRQGMPNGPP